MRVKAGRPVMVWVRVFAQRRILARIAANFLIHLAYEGQHIYGFRHPISVRARVFVSDH